MPPQLHLTRMLCREHPAAAHKSSCCKPEQENHQEDAKPSKRYKATLPHLSPANFTAHGHPLGDRYMSSVYGYALSQDSLLSARYDKGAGLPL